MKDKTILALVDRLVAANDRAALAERELEDLTEQYQQLEDALEVAKTRISELENDVKSKQGTVNFFFTKAENLEKELKALKEGKPDAAV